MLILKILLFGGALIREWALIRSFTVVQNDKVFITSFKTLLGKSLYCLIHRNVPDSLLSHIHFTDSEYIN